MLGNNAYGMFTRSARHDETRALNTEAVAHLPDRVGNATHRNDGQSFDRLPGLIRFGYQRMGETKLGGLPQPFLSALDRTHLAGKADLTEHDEPRWQRPVRQ